MGFATCAHGNIQITCPQCRGRQPAGPAPVSGFGLPTKQNERGHSDERKTLDLRLVIDDAVGRVTDTGQRQAAGVKAYWSQINAPTTIMEHEQEHKNSNAQ